MKNLVIALTVIGVAAASPAPAAEPERVVEQLTDSLYRVQDGRHNMMFLVTGDGIIVADPLNKAFATWLKAHLAEEFPDQPVRYVLQSHHHFDHASGAAVFDDTAEIIARDNFSAELAKARTELPPILQRIDANENGQVERSEIQGGPLEAFMDYADHDRNDIVTPQEMYKDVAKPESTFSERRTITLGGKTVEMIASVPSHSNDAAVIYFPDERAVFVVDFIILKKRFPNSFDGGNPLDQWIQASRDVEALDFDIAVAGHGETATKADVAAYREYLETLVDVVSEGIAEGRSVEDLQQDDAFHRYSDWVSYPEILNWNIAQAYGLLSAQD